MVAPLVIMAFAIALRVAWVLLVPSHPVGDFAMYRESAAHLLEYGALDPQFVYMPGYVALVAAITALGGGLLAVKLVGAVLGGLGVGAVYGITLRLWEKKEAVVAGVLAALWPAGIAISSVTGTDVPAAVLIAFAGFLLVHYGEDRPNVAAVSFGLAMGLASYVRAVAMPLAFLSVLYFHFVGDSWRDALKRGAIAGLMALFALSPWAYRNWERYGELFVTDSHGGLTALVGSNPNSEGTYSRSLNRMFHEVTGHKLLEEPHRQADRAAYEIAIDWVQFQPAYAIGLVAKKTERLLDHQRALLYWPLYRQGVLRDPPKTWFDRHRRDIETVVDEFWYFLVAASAVGIGMAIARRHFIGLSFVPLQVGLIGIYALFFAEVRYQVPIVLLMFPLAGAAVIWFGQSLIDLRKRAALGRIAVEALSACAALALVLGGWPAFKYLGNVLRDEHRFAVHTCKVERRSEFCLWRPVGDESSGLRGVWDGVGVLLSEQTRSGELELELPPGHYRLTAALDVAPLQDPLPQGQVSFNTGGEDDVISLQDISVRTRAGEPLLLSKDVTHPGGILRARLSVLALEEPLDWDTSSRLWLTNLQVSRIP